MDYFKDVLTTFLGHEHGSYVAVCVPRMNEGLTGLERYEGE